MSKVKSYPLVSIVVINYNGKKHLKACLDSLLKTDYPNFEIILVDNASNDGSVEYVTKNYPQVKVVVNKVNMGSSGGYNAGIRHARGKYIAILNNDVEVDKKWLEPLVRILEENSEIGAADSKYLNFYERNKFDSTSAAGRFLDYFGNVYARGVRANDGGVYNKLCRIFVALTIFRKKIFSEIGLFDEDFFYGYEDVDLSWRINLRGYKIYYVPSSLIFHKSSATVASNKRMKPEFYLRDKRNRLVTLIKNYSVGTLILTIPITLLEYLGLLIYWILKGEKIYALCIIKSIVQVFKSFKETWKKHLFVNQIRKISDGEVRKLMIPYAGYLKDLLKL
ncbi:MAG: glycosyltransferase family 2 protein [Thermoproteota archaeon]